VGYGFEELNYDNGIAIPLGQDNFQIARKGSVLICAEGGSAGKKCGLTNRDICFGNKLFANELYGNISARYILSFYLSPSFFSSFSKSMSGIIGGISKAKFETLLCPLPPLAEQHRIVAKLDELMALCDQLEQRQEDSVHTHSTLVQTLLDGLTASTERGRLEQAWHLISSHFDTLFTTESSIDALKRTILQLAVMGKLVTQDPSDESAKALLANIASTKLQLQQTGIIGKEKAGESQEKDDLPFEVPKSWQWAKLADLAELITKGSSPKWQGIDYVTQSDGILFITSENVGNYVLRKLDDLKYVSKRFNEIEPRSILKRGDILMNLVGASIGRCALYDLHNVANINQAVALIRLIRGAQGISPRFLLHYFNSPTAIDYMLASRVVNAQPNISLTVAREFPVPIPPLAEQHRIVAKVDELMALCDNLKASLQSAQATQLNLAESLVEAAIH
jgi:type I restriction enzyme S subunit